MERSDDGQTCSGLTDEQLAVIEAADPEEAAVGENQARTARSSVRIISCPEDRLSLEDCPLDYGPYTTV